MPLDFFKADLTLSEPIDLMTLPKIRGYLGRQFQEDSFFHQHEDEKLAYRYPLIQYKALNRRLTLLGIQEGSQSLKNALSKIEILELDNRTLKVEKIDTAEWQFEPRPLKSFQIYEFKSPYFAFNEKNYAQYQVLHDLKERKKFLNKILTGNILSCLKGLGIWVSERIETDLFLEKAKIIEFKGQNFTGIEGEFACNFLLPPFIGLGKSVSRGFGTILNRSRKT